MKGTVSVRVKMLASAPQRKNKLNIAQREGHACVCVCGISYICMSHNCDRMRTNILIPLINTGMALMQTKEIGFQIDQQNEPSTMLCTQGLPKVKRLNKYKGV